MTEQQALSQACWGGVGGSNTPHSTKLMEDLTQLSSGRLFLKVLMTVWACNAEEVQRTERSGHANTKLLPFLSVLCANKVSMVSQLFVTRNEN